MEESGRPRDPHKVEIAGSNPAPATTSTQPDEGSADCLPAICSGGNGGATGAPAEPVSSRGTQRAPHPSETSAYWRERARQQLAFAKDARSDRRAPVESIQIYERNAREYLAQAERIDRAEKEPQVAPRDPLTDPHPGDRVQVRSGLVAEVRGRLGETVSYAYADREGTHYAVAALSAWRSLCAGGKALAPEVQPGEAFDAVEVVR